MGFSGDDHSKWPSAPSQLAIVGGGGNLNGPVRLVNSRVSDNCHLKWPSTHIQLGGFRR